MPNQVLSSVENNFTKGLVTEFTGLNFPENAATDTNNCVYTLVGDVLRREGIDYEAHATTQTIVRANQAVSTYKWDNASGDGLTQLVVEQIGGTLYFYNSTTATVASPISTQKLASTVTLIPIAGSSLDTTIECQYATGSGYLFVYHPNCDPIYCVLTAGAVTSAPITIQIRDFLGIPEAGVTDNFRPLTLSNEHKYNLINQGWASGNPWSATSTTSVSFGVGAKTFTVATGLVGIVGGQAVTVTVPGTASYMIGTVTSYTTLTGALILAITSFNVSFGTPNPNSNWVLTPSDSGHINTWFSAIGNYPSNADVWWTFKNTSNVFDPATTLANTTIGSGPAPKGSMVLPAFTQTRGSASGVSGLTDTVTTVRPSNGCWFQGRVWYTGVNAFFSATGDAPYTTWTESIFFSQIIQQGNTTQFGKCYQQNDPTSETLFDLLPTDGGVITIEGCGPIYKLFPMQNAMLIFAANGVWYITGSSGIGFAATDYTIVKLSAIRSISSTSFVDVSGYPMFWNEEGIYTVEGAKQGTGLLNNPLHVNPLEVNPLTVGTIQTYYDNIPVQSKKYARGVYDPINYIIQWIFKSTNETSVTDRYSYDSVLNFNNHNKAFYPYGLDITTNSPPTINSIVYVSSPGGTGAPPSIIKYACSRGSSVTFAEENNTTYTDWVTSGASANYLSYFVTGYKLHGQGQRRFQLPYLYVYSRLNTPVSYKIQGLWDYASNRNSNKWSVAQLININNPNFGVMARRHVIRGQGLTLQIKVSSVDGMPFDVIGWSQFETQNTGV